MLINKIKKFISKEISGWSKLEVIVLLFSTTTIIASSIIMQDRKLAMISAICGILYTIIAGKGKISAFIFGIIGTLACALLSFKVALYGNFALHLFYFFPMEILGIINWKKHLQRENQEIIKTKLKKHELFVLAGIATLIEGAIYLILTKAGDVAPLTDSMMCTLSLAGMYLTVKRCIEQWGVWTIANLLSIAIWFTTFQAGEAVFSVLLVRIIYFFLGIYFFIKWHKNIQANKG
ncbi:nicotinamide mononucleotide transporter [bacterium]|nr:nicotinamide mononucleotide transporter [bacterium]